MWNIKFSCSFLLAFFVALSLFAWDANPLTAGTPAMRQLRAVIDVPPEDEILPTPGDDVLTGDDDDDDDGGYVGDDDDDDWSDDDDSSGDDDDDDWGDDDDSSSDDDDDDDWGDDDDSSSDDDDDDDDDDDGGDDISSDIDCPPDDSPSNNESLPAKNLAVPFAAVQNATLTAMDLAEEAVWSRLANRPGNHSGSWSAWLTPYYEHSHIRGMGPEGATTRRNSGGSAFGWDLDFEELIVGISGNYGYSKVTTQDSLVKSKTKSEFYNFMIYGDWASGPLRLYGGLGFGYDTHDMELEQYGFARQRRKDFDTLTMSSALFCEYTFTGMVNISPYAGIRYACIDTDGVRFADVNYKPQTQHILRFPVGLKFTRQYDHEGFFVRPGANFFVEPVCGDTDTKVKIHSRGMGINQTGDARMTDGFYWNASVGISAGVDAFVFNLSYGYHGSAHERRHGLSLTYNMLF